MDLVLYRVLSPTLHHSLTAAAATLQLLTDKCCICDEMTWFHNAMMFLEM